MLLWCKLPEDGDYAKISRSQVGEGIYTWGDPKETGNVLWWAGLL